MPTPRSTHRGLIVLKIAGSVILLADPRLTPYLPLARRQLPNPKLLLVAGGEGESCDTVCGRVGSPPQPLPLQSQPQPRPPPLPLPPGVLRTSTGPSPVSTPPPATPVGVPHVCAENHFQWINQCSVLMKHFRCERGCWGGVQGEDIPNYVSNPQKPEYYQHCLTTDGRSLCGAKHVTTSRLCPCVPR